MANWMAASGDSAGSTETLALLVWLREAVHNLGCSIKPGSRLAAFEKRLQRFEDPIYRPARDPDFDPVAMSHGARDLRELAFICRTLAPLHSDKLRAVLPTLLRGPVVPGDKPQNERPRNLQFEYFLAAQLVHSGLLVTLEEPDMIFVHDSESVPLAAKRMTRAGQVIPRLREAVSQLNRAGDRGLVALSLDRLLPVSPPYVGARSEQALDDAAATLLVQALRPHAAAAREVTRKSDILGLIVCVCIVGFIGAPWHPAFESAMLLVPRDDDLPEETETVKKIVAALRAPSE